MKAVQTFVLVMQIGSTSAVVPNYGSYAECQKARAVAVETGLTTERRSGCIPGPVEQR